MKNELIARYIYAVTCHLPLKARAEVEKELDSLISDMLEERCGGSPEEKDVLSVLLELGQPEELAAKYSAEENKSFISGIYFMQYKRILRLVLPSVAVGIAFVSILNLLSFGIDGQFGFTLMRLFGDVINGGMFVFALTTILFALLERKKPAFSGADFISKLPPVPTNNARIKPREPVANMIWHVLVAVLFIAFPQFIGGNLDGSGWIPALNALVMQGFLPLIMLWAAIGMAREALKLIEGRYTKRLAIVTVCANILILVITSFIWLNGNLMNPDFVLRIAEIFKEADGIAVKLLSNINYLMHFAISFALIIDAAIVVYRYRKYASPETPSDRSSAR